MKTCSKCKEEKPLTEYYRKGNGHKSVCKPCHLAYMKERNKSERAKELNRRNTARYRYGITDNELDCLKASPCTICGESMQVIDHNHETGKVRGALCNNCNSGLGFFKDRPDLLRVAAKYLEENGHYG